VFELQKEIKMSSTSSIKNAQANSVREWPIVYHGNYNISFLGMEKLHPFDAGKWGHIHQFLIGV